MGTCLQYTYLFPPFGSFPHIVAMAMWKCAPKHPHNLRRGSDGRQRWSLSCSWWSENRWKTTKTWCRKEEKLGELYEEMLPVDVVAALSYRAATYKYEGEEGDVWTRRNKQALKTITIFFFATSIVSWLSYYTAHQMVYFIYFVNFSNTRCSGRE